MSKCKSGDVNDACRSRPTDALPFADPTLKALGLRRSFATCGETYAPTPVLNQVVMTGVVNDPPWAFLEAREDRRLASGEDRRLAETVMEWKGVLPDFMKHVGTNLGATFQITKDPAKSLSQASKNVTTNDVDACLNDIAVGRLDLCMAAVWVTDERLKKASFLPALYQDNVYLVESDYSEETVPENLAKPFKPFSPALWIFTAILLAFMGMAFSEVEFQHIEHRGIRACAGIFYGLMSFLKVESTVFPETPVGMAMGLGIMFYILLAISAFTANLTTFIMMRRFSTGVENIADAVNFDYSICAYKPLGVQLATMVNGL